MRLDKFLATQTGEPRNQVEQLIKKGAVKVDGKEAKKGGTKVRPGSVVEVEFPQVQRSPGAEPTFTISKLYEDDDILVINKPAGVVVHGAPSVKEPTLVDWLKREGISLSTISGEERHGIVHRLDKETSGVMVVAKNNRAHRILAEQLKERSMGRYYLAIIEPPLKEDLTIDRPIGRNPKNRVKMGVVPSGREARSSFKKLVTSRDGREELIAVKLFTGRTHQIRVHLASINRHILGDYLYGFKRGEGKIGRVFLHAYILYLTHPSSEKSMEFVAPLPDDMVEYLREHFTMEHLNEKIDPTTLPGLFSPERLWRHLSQTGQAQG
ncbi:MAG: RluA family pseudouridine synthase [Epsilonproteobacteria bacterium]|nr:RluA family pseudouridine synthase [Campylobacterota bacterium]NPA57292.1 RluA family pseudouridine synthase [Campylobacterota bacterium]